MEELEPATGFFASFSVFGWPCTGVVTLLAILLYFVLTFRVAVTRDKHKVMPPDTEGHPDFRRAFRIQQNTLEQLIMFIPLLWIAALSSGDEWAAGFGAVWILGRILYARDYARDPKKRLPGFIISLAALALLFLFCAALLVRSVLIWQQSPAL
jgi:glutathione S-transferase